MAVTIRLSVRKDQWNVTLAGENLLDEKGVVDPRRVDYIGRMSGDWYARAHGDALFELERPRR